MNYCINLKQKKSSCQNYYAFNSRLDFKLPRSRARPGGPRSRDFRSIIGSFSIFALFAIQFHVIFEQRVVEMFTMELINETGQEILQIQNAGNCFFFFAPLSFHVGNRTCPYSSFRWGGRRARPLTRYQHVAWQSRKGEIDRRTRDENDRLCDEEESRENTPGNFYINFAHAKHASIIN